MDPATYSGVNGKKGTVETGKESNLLSLDKNPLEEIRNPRSINTVFKRKKIYDKRALSQMLEGAKLLGGN